VWNGIEFVNVRDYGREIQSSIGLLDRRQGGNPTEAGNRYSDSDLLSQPTAAIGSACVLATNDLTTPSSPTQRTLAIPLEWNPDQFGGGRTHPIIHREFQLGKEITLNYAGLGSVAEYKTVVIAQRRVSKASVEIPAVYLRGDLTVIELYDALAHMSITLPVPINRVSGTIPPSGWGGLIASASSGELAFGVYGVSSSQSGSIKGAGSGFQYGRFVDRNEQAPYARTAHTTTKISALAVGHLNAGRNVFRTFLISGTRSEVKRVMNVLAKAGMR
jgi:hypothetical protein